METFSDCFFEEEKMGQTFSRGRQTLTDKNIDTSAKLWEIYAKHLGGEVSIFNLILLI